MKKELKKKLNQFWAKNNGTSIREHTDALLENLRRLKALYGQSIEKVLPQEQRALFWKVLELACEYHDYGKLYPVFQKKVGNPQFQGKSLRLPDIRHNLISPAFINTGNELEEELTALAVINHHHYIFDEYEKKKLEEVLKQEFGKELWYVSLLDSEYRVIKELYEDYEKLYILVKGFLLRIDHASSSKVGIVERPPIHNYKDKVEEYIKRKGSELNSLQRWVLENLENSLMVVASTGMGKTEAGFLFLQGKGFFTLPVRTSANSIYLRACQIFGEDNCGLLHSSAYSLSISEDDQDHLLGNTKEGIINRLGESKNFAKPLIVCTPDQLFPFVFRFSGFEKYFSLFSYARIVLDEVQLYEPHTLGFIVFALRKIRDYFDGKVMVMTATLPEFVRKDLDFLKEPERPFLFEKPRHHIKVERSSILDEDVLKRMIEDSKERKVLVICNTVKRAVELYLRLKEREISAGLLHARFMLKDRQEREKEIKAFFDSKEVGIWITTQLAEVSLDLDADVLYTELSTADSLFQRLGRVNRKGLKDISEPNAFVFVEDCSGIGSVYRKSLFELTKEGLRDGVWEEQDKLNLVRHVYSEKILDERDEDYIRDYEEAMGYLKSLWEISHYLSEGQSKEKAQKLFRDIDSSLVIPVEFKDEVEKLLDSMKGEKDDIKRLELREEIYSFCISVPSYWLKDTRIGKVEGLKPEVYYIRCKYNPELGLFCTQEEELNNII